MTSLPKPKSLRSPSWRLDQCLDHGEEFSTDECPYKERLRSFLSADEGAPDDQILDEAYLLYYLPQSRAVLSSLLLAGADITSIAGYIGTHEDTVLVYSKLFFDTSVFPNKLVIKDYVDSLPESTTTQKHYKALMRAAISLGSRYIAWKMSLPIASELDVNEINKNLLEDSYWRSREHKPFGIDDPRAKESKSWIPQVLRTVDAITGSRTGGELSIETLRLKLVKTDSTISKAILSEDIKG